ncbi:MAG: porin [Reichenbachiella sp.]|uniref:porin n=1 Tax=Reichenbachiella sp. TaxID=2184521 RepID=UPI00329A0932
MRFIYITLALAICAVMAQAQSFDGSKIGNGIRFVPKDSSFSIQWNTRFQTQYIGAQDLETKEYADAFTIRRFRLKFKGHLYHPNIQYKIELAMSNRDQGDFFAEHNGAASIVLDAVLKWKFHPGWQLWVGQTKLPGNRERVISSGALQLVDRSRLNSRFNIDRDKGLWLHHEHKVGNVVVREILSATTGEGRNVTESTIGGYDFTFRGELLPFGKFTNKGDYFGEDLAREESPKLSLAATYDHNFGTSRQRGQLGLYILDEVDGEKIHSDLATIFVDMMFKYKGFSVMSEYVHKRVADGVVHGYTTSGEEIYFYTGQALNIQGGYLFKNNMSIDARFTDIVPERVEIDDAERRYELGFGKYIVGHTLKFQASIAYRDRATKNDNMIYSAQFEIGF